MGQAYEYVDLREFVARHKGMSIRTARELVHSKVFRDNKLAKQLEKGCKIFVNWTKYQEFIEARQL